MSPTHGAPGRPSSRRSPRPAPRLVLPALVGLALAISPVFAQETPSTSTTVPAEHIIVGEISDKPEGGFRIRPWNPKQPRRLQVTIAQSAPYLAQVEGDRRDLKPGDRVTVVYEKPKAEGKNGQQEKEQPCRTRAVLRFPKDADLGAESEQVLWEGAQNFFKGARRGGVNKPGKGAKLVSGTILAVKPLTVETVAGSQQFETERDMLVIDHQVIQPSDLKRGQTIVIHGETKPAADGTVHALLVARSARPLLNGRDMRKFLVREQGRSGR
jgi:hypothetical protein